MVGGSLTQSSPCETGNYQYCYCLSFCREPFPVFNASGTCGYSRYCCCPTYVTPIKTVNIQLVEGWNLISIPVNV